MSNNHNRDPQIDPGEYGATDESLHQLFSRMTTVVPKYGITDGMTAIVADDEQQSAKERLAYITDPLGTAALLGALGEDGKLNEVQQNAEEEKADYVRQGKDVDTLIKETAEIANNDSRTVDHELRIEDADLLKQAGFPDQVVDVSIFVDDATQNPVDYYVRRAMVIIGYNPNESRVPSDHRLMFEQLRGEKFGKDKDEFEFERIYEDATDITSTLPGSEQIRVNEVERLNKLLDLIEAK